MPFREPNYAEQQFFSEIESKCANLEISIRRVLKSGGDLGKVSAGLARLIEEVKASVLTVETPAPKKGVLHSMGP